jgi:hypothetical protein
MRVNLGLALVALLCPAVATAQSPSAAPTAPTPPAPAATAPATAAPSGSRARGGDITRDEYVARAVERAKHAAETRFDRMDLNHDGVLTADERRAARQARYHGDSAAEPTTPQPAAAKSPE